MSDLRLLRGVIPHEARLSGCRIALGGPDGAPFPVDALVVEDDTYLVLGADPAYRQPTEHPLRVMTAAHAAEPATPGGVVVRAGDAVRLHAIVHDLDRTPTWREAWVRSALLDLFEVARARRLRALELPVLGSRHGGVPTERFLDLLADALSAAEPAFPSRIRLRVTPDQAAHAAEWLARVASL